MLRPFVASAVVAAALSVVPAAHAAAPFCSESSRLVDFAVLDLPTYVAVQEVSPTRTDVCVRLAQHVGFLLAVDTSVGGSPAVTVSRGTGRCATSLLSMSEPLPLSVSVGADAATLSVCFELNGETTTITVGAPGAGPLPSVKVWTAGDTLVDYYYFCIADIAGYWRECAEQPHRIL